MFNVKEKFLTQNIQEVWDTMNKQNLRIIGLEKDFQLKEAENKLNTIIDNIFASLKKGMLIKFTAHQIDWNKKESSHEPHNNQNKKHTEERENIKHYPKKG